MKLVTWNIQWGRGVDGRVDLDRIVAHARRLADFDVLCLQEVADGYPDLPGGDGSDQFASLAARLPDYEAVAGVATDAPRPGGGRQRFGNMIFSRWPLGSVYRHLLPWPPDPAVPSMQRVAVEATVATPAGPLRVTTTHLEYYSSTQRRAQVERLRQLHAEAAAHGRGARPSQSGPFEPSPRGAAAVLTGDFNCAPDSAEHALVAASFDDGTPALQDAWQVAHPGMPHTPSVGVHDKQQWPGPPFTFDFVFVTEDLAPKVRDVRVDATSDGSDHQPVLLVLDTAS